MRGSQTCRLLCLCCQLAGCQDDAILRGTGVYARKFRNEITRRNGEVSSKGLRFGCQSCPCGYMSGCITGSTCPQPPIQVLTRPGTGIEHIVDRNTSANTCVCRLHVYVCCRCDSGGGQMMGGGGQWPGQQPPQPPPPPARQHNGQWTTTNLKLSSLNDACCCNIVPALKYTAAICYNVAAMQFEQKPKRTAAILIYTVSPPQQNKQNCSGQNFVKDDKIMWVSLVSTSPNLCQRTTVLNADVTNCSIMW